MRECLQYSNWLLIKGRKYFQLFFFCFISVEIFWVPTPTLQPIKNKNEKDSIERKNFLWCLKKNFAHFSFFENFQRIFICDFTLDWCENCDKFSIFSRNYAVDEKIFSFSFCTIILSFYVLGEIFSFFFMLVLNILSNKKYIVK